MSEKPTVIGKGHVFGLNGEHFELKLQTTWLTYWGPNKALDVEFDFFYPHKMTIHIPCDIEHDGEIIGRITKLKDSKLSGTILGKEIWQGGVIQLGQCDGKRLKLKRHLMPWLRRGGAIHSYTPPPSRWDIYKK